VCSFRKTAPLQKGVDTFREVKYQKRGGKARVKRQKGKGKMQK
jgi:hypothetical protein